MNKFPQTEDKMRDEILKLRRQAKLLAACLHADKLPFPPLTTYPPDEFAEQYRQWYHRDRAKALIAYNATT